MQPRDPQLLEAVMATSFSGYSRRTSRLPAPFVDRVIACIVLLTTMVMSGIALGSAKPKTLER